MAVDIVDKEPLIRPAMKKPVSPKIISIRFVRFN